MHLTAQRAGPQARLTDCQRQKIGAGMPLNGCLTADLAVFLSDRFKGWSNNRFSGWSCEKLPKNPEDTAGGSHLPSLHSRQASIEDPPTGSRRALICSPCKRPARSYRRTAAERSPGLFGNRLQPWLFPDAPDLHISQRPDELPCPHPADRSNSCNRKRNASSPSFVCGSEDPRSADSPRILNGEPPRTTGP